MVLSRCLDGAGLRGVVAAAVELLVPWWSSTVDLAVPPPSMPEALCFWLQRVCWGCAGCSVREVTPEALSSWAWHPLLPVLEALPVSRQVTAPLVRCSPLAPGPAVSQQVSPDAMRLFD